MKVNQLTVYIIFTNIFLQPQRFTLANNSEIYYGRDEKLSKNNREKSLPLAQRAGIITEFHDNLHLVHDKVQRKIQEFKKYSDPGGPAKKSKGSYEEVKQALQNRFTIKSLIEALLASLDEVQSTSLTVMWILSSLKDGLEMELADDHTLGTLVHMFMVLVNKAMRSKKVSNLTDDEAIRKSYVQSFKHVMYFWDTKTSQKVESAYNRTRQMLMKLYPLHQMLDHLNSTITESRVEVFMDFFRENEEAIPLIIAHLSVFDILTYDKRRFQDMNQNLFVMGAPRFILLRRNSISFFAAKLMKIRRQLKYVAITTPLKQ